MTLNQRTVINNPPLGTGTSVHEGVRSAVRVAEFVSDRMSYIILRGRWCDIVLNVHASSKDESGDTNANIHVELEWVFNQFSMYRMKILLGHFNAKMVRENILKPTMDNENLHKIIMILELGN
jgi:hypothetical protein